MSYELYYSAGACSKAVHVILNELNVPAKFTSANKPGSKERSPEFLKLNPRGGTVPLLIVDGTPVNEGAAIITYLCDTHPNTLLPKSGLPRAKALEALMFCNSTLHPAYGKAFAAVYSADLATREQSLKQACAGIQKLLDMVEQTLAQQKYLAGNEMTAGDILLTVICGWNGMFGDSLKLGPNLTRLTQEISARPAYRTASETEAEPQKQAA